MIHSLKMHSFGDAGLFSSAKSLEHMLEGGTSTPPYHPLHYSSRLFRSSPSSVKVYLACISESIHFLTMNHRRKKSSLDAFYPYSTLKAPKPKKKIEKIYLNIFLFMYTFFQNLFWRVWGLFVHDWDRPCLKSLHLKKTSAEKKELTFIQIHSQLSSFTHSTKFPH